MTQGHLRIGRTKEENRPVSNKQDALNHSGQGLNWGFGPHLEPRTQNATLDPSPPPGAELLCFRPEDG